MKLKFSAIDMCEPNIPNPIERNWAGKGYITWGESNKYPYEIYDIYKQSALLGSIVQSIIDFTLGDGLEINSSIKPTVNNEGDNMEDLIKRLVSDYILFGAFAVECIRNKSGEVCEYYWLDMRRLRMNQDRDVFYYADWSKSTRGKIVELPKYNKDSKDSASVFFVTNKLERDVYPQPIWSGAVKAAMTSTQIANFHLHSILNNFQPSAIVSFNGLPDIDQQKEIERKLNEKFSGTSNASKLLVVFNEDKDHGTELSRLQEDNFDQKYQALAESTLKELFTAFRINPILCGYNVETGFSKEEFLQAFELCNKTLISPIQSTIERAIDQLFSVENSISFKEFKIYADVQEGGEK